MSEEEKCLMCGRKVEAGWGYEWKGERGYMHREPCGRDFHSVGYYLLDKAQETLEEQGIRVYTTKEKFGCMELRSGARTEAERANVIKLQAEYQGRYPEFTWYFH